MYIINIDNQHIFKQTISMLECVSIAKKHIENNIAENSSGTKDIDNKAKLLNRIAEYAVMSYIRRNYYIESVISCDDRAIHHALPKGTVLIKGIGLGQIDQKIHAEALRHARKLIQQLMGWNENE